MTRDAIEIADHFIARSGNTKTHLQVQKMTYFAHGFMLGVYGIPLIHDKVEAWDWGPVIPSLWKRFRRYGSDIILAKPRPPREPFTDREQEILDAVWNYYGKFCGYYLSSIAHDDGSGRETPWARCHVRGKNRPIPDDTTEQYYKQLCESMQRAPAA